MTDQISSTTISASRREVYSVSEAARLLGRSSRTVEKWRSAARGYKHHWDCGSFPELVEWGEFLTLAFLRECTRGELTTARKTPLGLARTDGWPVAIIGFGSESERRPWTELARPALRYLAKVRFVDGHAVTFHPAGFCSPVVIDPLRCFGEPSVRGVATENLWDRYHAGESIEDIAYEFGPSAEEVRAAISYQELFECLRR